MKRCLVWLLCSALCQQAWAGGEVRATVDTAVTVPVNLMPLVDDGDFKTRETSVAYNAAGMDLVWNFMTTAGVITQTAVTPTDTGGNYDWTNVGDGMYKIEIPASGGASINNDTEGYGWFTGIATGVYLWRGPVIEFTPANVSNSLTNGTDKLETDTTQWNGTNVAAPATAGYPAVTIKDGTGTGEINTNGGVIVEVTTIGDPVEVGAINVAGVEDLFEVDSGLTQADAVAGSLVREVATRVIEDSFTYDATATYAGANAGSLVKQIADNAGGSALTTDAIVEAMFTYDATATYGTANAGSAVKQIADNAGGSSLTEEGIADEVATRTLLANVTQLSGDSTAADNAEAYFDGTGYGPLIFRKTVTAVSGPNSFQAAGLSAASGQLYNGATLIIRKQSDPTEIYLAFVDNYDDSQQEIGFNPANATSLTLAAGDIVDVVAPGYGFDDRLNAAVELSRIGTPSNLGGGATLSANLSDIEGQTDDIGAAGAGLTALPNLVWTNGTRTLTAGTNINGSTFTAIPWAAAWDAEVQSEVNDALEAIHLDHLLAADYDPASKPGVATALLNELIESDSGVSQFTENALEEAPAGGGPGGGSLTSEEHDWLEAIFLKLPTGAIAGAGIEAPTLDEVLAAIEALGDVVGDIEAGSTQPRINRKPDPAFTYKVSRRSDGTYGCTAPLRIVPGAVETLHPAIDMSPLFGTENFVETVGTPTINGGAITVEAEGPRDWFAFIEVDGDAEPGEERVITIPVTMTSGAVVQVKLDAEVFDE